MKFGKTKLHIGHLISVFMAFVIGVSLSYVGISTYTHLIEARGLDILSFLSVEKLTPPITCPQLKEVPGTYFTASIHSRILKDECSGTYWHSMDLPILDKNDQFVGYTWQEAKTSCENLARVDLLDGNTNFNVFRLPTVDELLTLVDVPCTGTAGCSPLTRLEAMIPGASVSSVPVTLNGGAISPSVSYFYKKQNKALGNGSYWASNSLDANTAGSVNLLTGTVNNPALGKSIKLNVRCVYNTPGSINSGNLTDPGNQVFWVQGSTTSNIKIAYRSNIQKPAPAATNCPAPFTTGNSVNQQCTGQSTNEFSATAIAFDCHTAPYTKPYLRQVCKTTVGGGSGTECVSDADCTAGGEKCVFDTVTPTGCKNPQACFTGYKYYIPSTCSNDPARDCQVAADCIQSPTVCSVSKAACSNTGDCGATGGTCGVTCETPAEGQCVNEKTHVCKLPSLTNGGASLDLATDHVAYNTASEYAQTYVTATDTWSPASDWWTDYSVTPSAAEAQDCRFKAAPGYFWNGSAGINARDYQCPAKPANTIWNMLACSNDPTKACTVATAAADCGAGTCTDASNLGQYHQDYNGSAWVPSDSGAQYSELTPYVNVCVFKSTDLTQWGYNGSVMTSVHPTYSCPVLTATGATRVGSPTYPQTWNYTSDDYSTGVYSPVATNNTWSTTPITNSCVYQCPNNTLSATDVCDNTVPTNAAYTQTATTAACAAVTLNTATCVINNPSCYCQWQCAVNTGDYYTGASWQCPLISTATINIPKSSGGEYLMLDQTVANEYCKRYDPYNKAESSTVFNFYDVATNMDGGTYQVVTGGGCSYTYMISVKEATWTSSTRQTTYDSDGNVNNNICTRGDQYIESLKCSNTDSTRVVH